MKALTLLAIDDDDLILQTLKMGLPPHWKLLPVNDFRQAPSRGAFSAALVDMHLSGHSDHPEGPEVIENLKAQMPHLEIVAMSGDLDRDLMEKCLRAGATRYIAKPLNMAEVTLVLEKIEALLLLQAASFRQPDQSVAWIGQSEPSLKVKRQVANLRGENGAVLIEGETGTGKEVVAQLIRSQNPEAPFIAVNVAAIPENLFESEIFGHVRGAFTGADQNKVGLAEAADGGFLFLDEIEALSMPQQAKLLRFLESGEIRRVGAKDPIRLNVNVIAATNRKLEQMVQDGQFREDLLWRLSAKKILLPPLRDRIEDVVELANWFLAKDRVRKKELSSDAILALKEYSWPGNVRELRRICEQLAISAPLPVIRKEEVVGLIHPAGEKLNRSLPSTPPSDFSAGLDKLVMNFETQIINEALRAHTDIDEAAAALKISRSSLYKKIKEYNIEWKQKRD